MSLGSRVRLWAAQLKTNSQSTFSTRQPGYAISLSRRWLVEKVFGWLKQTGRYASSMHTVEPPMEQSGDPLCAFPPRCFTVY
jgi:hypothetical protein